MAGLPFGLTIFLQTNPDLVLLPCKSFGRRRRRG
jgi:hypothetical protein